MTRALLTYEILVGLVAIERCVELVVARRHTRKLVARGGIEHGREHYPWIVGLHVAWLVSAAVEPYLAERPVDGSFASLMLGLVLLAQALRWWCIRTLGVHWTTRVIVVPNAPRVRRGPYRSMKHPNYVAVVLEVAALPLVHGAWLTAFVFTVANAGLLVVRLRVEDAALRGMREPDRLSERARSRRDAGRACRDRPPPEPEARSLQALPRPSSARP